MTSKTTLGSSTASVLCKLVCFKWALWKSFSMMQLKHFFSKYKMLRYIFVLFYLFISLFARGLLRPGYMSSLFVCCLQYQLFFKHSQNNTYFKTWYLHFYVLFFANFNVLFRVNSFWRLGNHLLLSEFLKKKKKTAKFLVQIVFWGGLRKNWLQQSRL